MLETKAQEESAHCGTPATAAAPPGDYADQGVRVRYDKLIPEPEPLKNVDAAAFRETVVDAKRLEQVYYDATHGHARAAWLLCQLEVGARDGGRTAARQLASLSCQTVHHCAFHFDKLPFSKDTASGRRLLALIGQEFEAQAKRFAVGQEIIGKALGALIGLRMASQLQAESAAVRPVPRELADAALGQISALYSSKAPVAEGLTVRQWLSSQSFEAQREFGLNTLRRYGAIP